VFWNIVLRNSHLPPSIYLFFLSFLFNLSFLFPSIPLFLYLNIISSFEENREYAKILFHVTRYFRINKEKLPKR
jgi:hypothetical protein